MAAEHLAQLLEDTSIDCAPLGAELERRVQAKQTSWTAMARSMGWMRSASTAAGNAYQTGDGSRLKRAVGKAPYKRRRGPNRGRLEYQTRITFELAEAICERLDVDMVEVGL